METKVLGCEVYQGETLIATFDQEWRAKQWVETIEKPSEEFLYWQDVGEMAESIKSELDDQIKDGTRGETLREWLIEHIDESIDGCGRVIYTYKAQQCLLFSRNDSAYGDEFGPEGMVEDGCICWSRLAYAAFRADVLEQLENDGVDVNQPWPKCTDCDDEDVTRQDGDVWYCADCDPEKQDEDETEVA
jgi:hypothetical protein